MNFKGDENRLIHEYFQIDPRLRQILSDMEVLAYPEPMTITCIVRTEEENTAAGAKTLIHVVKRAADVRMFKPETNERIVNTINQMYVYDPKRPNIKTVVVHQVPGGAMHNHVQVRSIADIHKELGLSIV